MSDLLNYRITITTDRGEVTWNFEKLSEAYPVFKGLKEGKAGQPCTVRLLDVHDYCVESFTVAGKENVNYLASIERAGGMYLLANSPEDCLMVD